MEPAMVANTWPLAENCFHREENNFIHHLYDRTFPLE